MISFPAIMMVWNSSNCCQTISTSP
jgi:hypothetical protein